MIGTLSTGHYDLSDWLLLIGALVFVIGAVLSLAPTATARPSWLNAITLQFIGLTLLTLALFVT